MVFKNEFKEAIPNLSFGLSVTHYKYPLSEAFTESYELLKRAKKEGGNRLAVQLLKHSGSELVTVFDKTLPLYADTLPKFFELLNDKEASNSAITYKLRDNEKVFEQIGLRSQRVTHFVNHLTGAKDESAEAFEKLADNNEKFMRLVKDTISRAYKQKADELVSQNMDKISEAAMKEVYSMLRIVKFVKGIDDDKS
jgi:CRISPR-associated protein Cmr2